MIPFHLFRNKLTVIQGVINDLILGNKLNAQDLQDAKAAVETVLAVVIELESKRSADPQISKF